MEKKSYVVCMGALFAFLSSVDMSYGQTNCFEGIQQRWTAPVQSSTGLRSVQAVLLRRYGEFKGYNPSDPSSVRERLSEDRYGVFDAVTRAMFTPIRVLNITTRELRTKGSVIDCVYAVVGIWGVRLGDKKGAHAFRLTVVADPEIREVLTHMGSRRSRTGETETFGRSRFSHILVPSCQSGQGDDDPQYSAWTSMPEDELLTVRQSGRLPKIQISFWDRAASYALLEVDVDFHPWGVPFPWSRNTCHETPSNSDPGIADHPSDLEVRQYRLPFASRFTAPCSVNRKNHCARVYKSYCIP